MRKMGLSSSGDTDTFSESDYSDYVAPATEPEVPVADTSSQASQPESAAPLAAEVPLGGGGDEEADEWEF